jgi:hypothetical protein
MYQSKVLLSDVFLVFQRNIQEIIAEWSSLKCAPVLITNGVIKGILMYLSLILLVKARSTISDITCDVP